MVALCLLNRKKREAGWQGDNAPLLCKLSSFCPHCLVILGLHGSHPNHSAGFSFNPCIARLVKRNWSFYIFKFNVYILKIKLCYFMIFLVFKSLSHLLGFKKVILRSNLILLKVWTFFKTFHYILELLITRSGCAIHMLNFYMPHVSFLHKTVVILPIKVTGELREACMLCPCLLWDAKWPRLACCRRSCKAKLRTSRLGANGLPSSSGHHSTGCPRACVTSQGGFVDHFHSGTGLLYTFPSLNWKF